MESTINHAKTEEDNAEGNYLMPSSICHEFQNLEWTEREDPLNKPFCTEAKIFTFKGKNSALKGDDLSVKIL